MKTTKIETLTLAKRHFRDAVLERGLQPRPHFPCPYLSATAATAACVCACRSAKTRPAAMGWAWLLIDHKTPFRLSPLIVIRFVYTIRFTACCSGLLAHAYLHERVYSTSAASSDAPGRPCASRMHSSCSRIFSISVLRNKPYAIRALWNAFLAGQRVGHASARAIPYSLKVSGNLTDFVFAGWGV